MRVLAAFAKLYRYVQGQDSKDAFIKSYMTVTSDKDDVGAVWGWNFIQANKPYSTDITLTEERLRYMQELNVKTEVQQSVLPFEQVADMSLARDAVKLI